MAIFNPTFTITNRMAPSITRIERVRETFDQPPTQLRDWLLPMLMNGQVTVA